MSLNKLYTQSRPQGKYVHCKDQRVNGVSKKRDALFRESVKHTNTLCGAKYRMSYVKPDSVSILCI